MNDFKDKVAVVTGAGSGIGRAIALALASEGCAVVVVDRVPTRADEVSTTAVQQGGRAVAVAADVAVAQQVEHAFIAAIDAFGRLDILVNNAGIGFLGTVSDLSEEDWDRVMTVNVKSVFLCSRAAIPHMKGSGGGRIVNVASVTGLVASPGRAAYCASKAAVIMLTRAMALDCAHLQINVNAICPGVVETAMTEASLQDPATRQEKVDKTPLGRLARPEEIAPAALYLAGPGADFVTGACLAVDGGWSID